MSFGVRLLSSYEYPPVSTGLIQIIYAWATSASLTSVLFCILDDHGDDADDS